MNNQVINYCKDGNCSRCGGCCTDFIFISDSEITKIKQFLKKHPVKEQHGAKDFNGRIPFLCPFYDSINKKCLVYSVRPSVCRMFQCNKSSATLDSIKATYTAPKFHNVVDRLSLHKIFFNNDLQQNAVNQMIDNFKKQNKL